MCNILVLQRVKNTCFKELTSLASVLTLQTPHSVLFFSALLSCQINECGKCFLNDHKHVGHKCVVSSILRCSVCEPVDKMVGLISPGSKIHIHILEKNKCFSIPFGQIQIFNRKLGITGNFSAKILVKVTKNFSLTCTDA